MTKFNATSIRRMSGVDPRLVAVMKEARAASPIPFEITEGLRDKERQRYLVRTGKSRTMNSYHLRGKAVDVVAMPGGKVSWSLPDYRAINTAVQKAAKAAGVTVVWGGSWKSIVDGPHFEIRD
jgi:peptidoglycan L-alanyl-D-glutamate endopeptidase CwlK